MSSTSLALSGSDTASATSPSGLVNGAGPAGAVRWGGISVLKRKVGGPLRVTGDTVEAKGVVSSVPSEKSRLGRAVAIIGPAFTRDPSLRSQPWPLPGENEWEQRGLSRGLPSTPAFSWREAEGGTAQRPSPRSFLKVPWGLPGGGGACSWLVCLSTPIFPLGEALSMGAGV